jgi:hypothetical protein
MRAAIPPLPNTPSWRGAQFRIKHRDDFIEQYIKKTDCVRNESEVTDFIRPQVRIDPLALG